MDAFFISNLKNAIKKDILLKEIKNYDEILLLGSGKGVTSVRTIHEIKWKRKNLENFKIRAVKNGVSKEIVDETLNQVKIIPRIIELDRNQPEFTLTLTQYLNNVVSSTRKKKGISKIRENWTLLKEISDFIYQLSYPIVTTDIGNCSSQANTFMKFSNDRSYFSIY